MYILSVPAIYSLELTPACNNRCPGCSNIYHNRRGRPALSDAQWLALLRQIAPDATQLRLTGGEPTLHPGFFDILDAATSYQAWVTVFTNGRWEHPRDFVRRLAGTPHLSGLLISLHGPQPASHEAFSRVSGSFADTISGICLAIEHGLAVTLSTVITVHNWDQTDAMVALARRLGVQRVAFNRYIGPPQASLEPTRAQIRATVHRIESLLVAGEPVTYGVGVPQCFVENHSEGCLAGVAYASIDPWGNLHPCAHSPTVIGSLLKTSIAELWHNESMNQWRSLIPADCMACAALETCHGGCRASQELRLENRDPLRQLPLAEFKPLRPARSLPATARPRVIANLRPEAFGFAVIGCGQVLPVAVPAKTVIDACDGTRSFAELTEQFGMHGLELLGELWEAGMLVT